jgi:hypothetical protein
VFESRWGHPRQHAHLSAITGEIADDAVLVSHWLLMVDARGFGLICPTGAKGLATVEGVVTL